jgi:hypothetical protein
VFEGFYHRFYLVDSFTIPIAPLGTIHRTKVAVLISPLVPNAYAVIGEVFDIGIAF